MFLVWFFLTKRLYVNGQRMRFGDDLKVGAREVTLIVGSEVITIVCVRLLLG